MKGSDTRIIGNHSVSTIISSRLYDMVSTRSYAWHKLEIGANQGFKIYTFTFG